MEDMNSLPLHLCRVDKSSAIINRTYILLQSAALTALIYYRASSLFRIKTTHLLPWLLVFSSELILSFIWFLGIGYRWRPVKRTVFPERLPEDEALPAIDVFICTADPSKEPTVEVMNTVISAMALDYPPEKIHVYVSDDGGTPVTLLGMKEAWKFAALWIPFCRRHEIKTRCPEAYFSESCGGHSSTGTEFTSDEKKVKEKYEIFKDRVMSITKNGSTGVSRDHPSVIEVISNKYIGEASAEKDDRMPLLVYVSREKRPSHPHHFKAGALNVLLRVSAMISNSPFLLVLDCDMYCNDPTSVRQAMCFHLDPKISPSLAFVQFPQRFHNLNKADIYDSNLRDVFKRMWLGMDGANGPCLSGTCFYLKREPLLGDQIKSGVDIMELKESFGPSNEFMKSLGKHYKPNRRDFSSEMLIKEINFLASCAYEEQTKWGKEVGLLYFSVVEDYFTSLVSLHGKGWTSVYHDPERPAFLGAGTTNLNDVLVQSTRWTTGLVEVALSRFCPLIYARKKLSTLHTMCYSELAFFPFYFLPVWCFATIPQLCLLNGISLYPEVSTKFFLVFLFIFLSSNAKLIQEILSTGGSVLTWRNVQLMWMIKSVTCHMYGSLDAIKETIGLREASFLLTNKVVDDEQFKLYEMGKFDFQTSTMLLVPVVFLFILNLISLIGGLSRVVITGSFSEMFIQVFLSFFGVAMSYPVIEGMVLRKDKGRIPPSITIFSCIVSLVLLSLGSFVLMYL